MCVLIYATTFVRNIVHSKKKWARYDQKSISVMLSTSYSCPILLKLELPGTVFFPPEIKYSNIMKIRPVGAELFQTDVQTWRS